jgi:uncharacterized membrane protein YjgN (DUF898 family)
MTPSEDFSPTLILGARLPQQPPLSQQGTQQLPEEASGPEPITFTGTGGEYFRIWIVNLLLNIVTCGIYSAWAKVRKMRYFYDSTHIAGSTFEYHGKPVAILKGRLIAGGLLVAYNVAPKISMTAGYVMMAIFAMVMPWLTWKSLQFKLYNSSYRGIRFGFLGSCGRAYKVYLLYPILTVLTLGLLTPFTHQRIKKFQHDESRFGTTNFSFHGSVGKFYGAYFIALVVFILGILWIMPVFRALGTVMFEAGGKKGAGTIMAGLFFMFAVFAWGHMVYSIFMTMLQNTIWSNTKLEEHQFKSDMAWTRVVYISFTNLVFIALSFGLYTPFAKIRMLKYRVESMSMIPEGTLDGFVADTAAEVSAASEGVTDLLDFDFAL